MNKNLDVNNKEHAEFELAALDGFWPPAVEHGFERLGCCNGRYKDYAVDTAWFGWWMRGHYQRTKKEIFVLCERGTGYGEFSMIGWGFDRSELEAEAARKNMESFVDSMKRWASAPDFPKPIHPDSPGAERRFFVETICNA